MPLTHTNAGRLLCFIGGRLRRCRAVDTICGYRRSRRFAPGPTYGTPQEFRLFIGIAEWVARLPWLARRSFCAWLDDRCGDRLSPRLRPRLDARFAGFDNVAWFANVRYLPRNLPGLSRLPMFAWLAEFARLPRFSRFAHISWRAAGIPIGIGLGLTFAAAIVMALLVPVLIAVGAEAAVVAAIVIVSLATRAAVEIAVAAMALWTAPLAALGSAVALLVARLIRRRSTATWLLVEAWLLRLLPALRIEHAGLGLVATDWSDRLLT